MAGRNEIRILVVEDEMLIRELVMEELTDAGFAVVAVATGDEAAALLGEDRQFDLLLTDIDLPGEVDGRSLANRAREAIPDLPVIYATGLTDDLDDLEPGGRCIRKPYLIDDVLRLMTEMGVVSG
jgi:CheY-like chemotaxis protein